MGWRTGCTTCRSSPRICKSATGSSRTRALIQGVAPFVELHYNTAVETSQSSVAFNGVPVIESRSYNDVNVTVGASMLLRNNLSISQGLVFPLRDSPDRFFDWQYGLRLNWLFGAQPMGPDRFAPGTGTAATAPGSPAAPGAPPGSPADAPPMADPGAVARAPEAGTQPAGTLIPACSAT